MTTPLPILALAAAAVLVAPVCEPASQDRAKTQDRAIAKRERLRDNAADFWIYDDLYKAEELASKNGKPLLVSFRCVP